MDDGVIKFDLKWERGDAPDCSEMSELMRWRDRMFELGLIGYDETHQVGYGNISLLPAGKTDFIISGTQTGHLQQLSAQHYTTVTDYDIVANKLTCSGPVKASSESLTHAAIYETDNAIRAVIHIHHDVQWKKWLWKVPTTSDAVPYGTPEMAGEIKRLFETRKSGDINLITMAGHQGGIISFGANMEEAARPILKTFKPKRL